MSDVPTDALRTTVLVRGLVRSPAPLARGVRSERPPELTLFLDTETRTDASQRLLFGSARLHDDEGFVREWLFHPDDLSAVEFEQLRAYALNHADDRGGSIRLLPVADFVRLALGRLAYKGRARVVGFNLPFDLSRLAFGWSEAAKDYAGGFSLRLFDWLGDDGERHPDHFLPNVRVKSLGSKRQRIGFAAPGARTERPADNRFRGRFVDLRQLADSLTDRSYTLDGAARAFGVGQRKAATSTHGRITESYIDYNRQDVRTTAALHDALISEWEAHPIDLAPERSFSAATVGRAYLQAMGIRPPLAKAGNIDATRLGQAMSAYFGGRAEVRIRRTAVPVRYVDFTSMYPTVFELCGFWSWVTAASFRVDDATRDAREFLDGVDLDSMFNRSDWPSLAGAFCLVEPDGDLLPVRADYGANTAHPDVPGAPSIGLNPLWSSAPLWYPMADLVAAKILGGRTPKVLEAFRVVPVGQQPGLRPVRLRGVVEVDPRTDSLFRVAIEERNRIRRRTDLSGEERDRTGQFLKTLANAAAYGIFAQVDIKEPTAAGFDVEVDGLWSFRTHVAAQEAPGAFCFPPLAATITAAGRLLLALLQAEVDRRGGTFLACDTDSLLIVASPSGGVAACPGGSEVLLTGESAIRVLSDCDVADVVKRFAGLNPYATDAVPSLLKIEAENYNRDDPARLIELWGVGISAKRFCLYERTDPVTIRKASEHGLGLYRRPVRDPARWSEPWPYWVDVVWRRIVDEIEGRSAASAPRWFRLPAVGQVATTTWSMLAPFERHGSTERDRVRPYNFMLVGHADPLVPLPRHLGPHVTPIAPYSSNPAELLRLPWRNRVDGGPIQVTTEHRGRPGAVSLKTYRDVVRDYRWHPERKSGDPGGGVGLRRSRGILPRRPVVALAVRHIGKETNRLDEVEEGLVDVSDDAHIQYVDERGEWERLVPTLRAIGVPELARRTGMSQRTLRSNLNSGRLPRSAARVLLRALAIPAEH